jgi:hypothetical protein
VIKFVLAAIWISAATLGAVLYSFQASQARNGAESISPFFGGLDYVRTGVMSVPVAKDGRVDGYFLARLVYTIDSKKLKSLSLPAEILLLDELHSYIYGNPQIDFSNREKLDLSMFRGGLRDSVNARVGDTFVHEVLIEQIDYLSKDDIRDNALRRRVAPER